MHLKMRKFNLATLYFSKAIKFLESSQMPTTIVPQNGQDTKQVQTPWSENLTQPSLAQG
jgi:hypothetical protein